MGEGEVFCTLHGSFNKPSNGETTICGSRRKKGGANMKIMTATIDSTA
jgi:hypothetical protein